MGSKFIFYVKPNTKFIHIDKNTEENDLYSEYVEVTPIDKYINSLLIQRGNWISTPDPFKHDYINFSFLGSDVAVKRKEFTTLRDTEGNDINVVLKDILTDNNLGLIEQYENKKTITDGVKFNREVFKRSQMCNRLSKITNWASDKTKLYNLVKSYGRKGVDIIPYNFEINTSQKDMMDIIRFELKENNITRESVTRESVTRESNPEVWVVKPTSSSRGLGMYITDSKTIIDNFETWHKMKYKSKIFTTWLFSKFIQSFLWKLKIPTPPSLKLCNNYKLSNGKMLNDIFHNTGLWNKEKVIRSNNNDAGENGTPAGEGLYYFKLTNPTISKKYSQFRNHSFNDTFGRINKGRLWFGISINDNKYKIYVYKKILFEICSKEFDKGCISHYSDIQRTWTDANFMYYGQDNDLESGGNDAMYKLDPINASRAGDMDLAYIVDWDTGEWSLEGKIHQFPLKWEKVKSGFMTFLNTFINATKYNLHCSSELGKSSIGCFQYFGMDFIVDENSSVWLLELNTRPWSGYTNWWNVFDPNNEHMPNKFEFVESLLRNFVDPYFKGAVQQFTDKDIKQYWINVIEIPYTKLHKPLAIINQNIPIIGEPNWIMNRQIHRALRNRGWSTFPFADIADNPDLVMQGVTDYIKWVYSNFEGSQRNKKIKMMYPYLQNAKIVNKIFPFIHFLGNKSTIVDKLKIAYPRDWDSIVPFSEVVEYKDIEKIQVNPKQQWIVKPSHGKQGTGIIISNDSYKIIDYIKTYNIEFPNEKNNNWVVSRYIHNPFLTQDRKTHVRIFVLVHRHLEDIKVYIMEKHLMFMAGIPYNNDKAVEFVNKFFNEKGKGLFFEGKLKEQQNLTNLSKGSVMIRNYLLPKKDLKNIKNPTEFEKKIINGDDTNTFLAYNILSGDAEVLIDQNNKGFYRQNIIPKIESLVNRTIYAVKDKIDCTNRYDNCFHYLAFDIMIDSSSNVWLLEVNTSPGLKAPTNRLQGGMNQFINSIYSHVLGDNPETIVEKTQKTYEKDGIHYNMLNPGERGQYTKDIQGKEWVRMEHKKGDYIFRRYNCLVGEPMYDNFGYPVEKKCQEAFRRGDPEYNEEIERFAKGTKKHPNVFKLIQEIKVSSRQLEIEPILETEPTIKYNNAPMGYQVEFIQKRLGIFGKRDLEKLDYEGILDNMRKMNRKAITNMYDSYVDNDISFISPSGNEYGLLFSDSDDLIEILGLASIKHKRIPKSKVKKIISTVPKNVIDYFNRFTFKYLKHICKKLTECPKDIKTKKEYIEYIIANKVLNYIEIEFPYENYSMLNTEK